jgi:hypothetical protein
MRNGVHDGSGYEICGTLRGSKFNPALIDRVKVTPLTLACCDLDANKPILARDDDSPEASFGLQGFEYLAKIRRRYVGRIRKASYKRVFQPVFLPSRHPILRGDSVLTQPFSGRNKQQMHRHGPF